MWDCGFTDVTNHQRILSLDFQNYDISHEIYQQIPSTVIGYKEEYYINLMRKSKILKR